MPTEYPPTTAQNVLQGEYDFEWMIMKARSDLGRAMASVPNFHFAAMDFAVAIASMADWAYMVSLQHSDDWASQKNPRTGLANFTKQVARQSIAVAAFSDLANEFKHADRTSGSKILARLSVYMFASEADVADKPNWLANSIQQRSDGGMVFVPTILTTSESCYLFKPLAEAALDWWKAFDPATFSPSP